MSKAVIKRDNLFRIGIPAEYVRNTCGIHAEYMRNKCAINRGKSECLIINAI
jgi:hypothetical protein